MCWSPWGHKESEMTQGLKNKHINDVISYFKTFILKSEAAVPEELIF